MTDHLGIAGGMPVIDYDAMVHRLAVAFPQVDRTEIEQIAQQENEAITGGRLLAVPALVEVGVTERLETLAPDATAAAHTDDDLEDEGEDEPGALTAEVRRSS